VINIIIPYLFSNVTRFFISLILSIDKSVISAIKSIGNPLKIERKHSQTVCALWESF